MGLLLFELRPVSFNPALHLSCLWWFSSLLENMQTNCAQVHNLCQLIKLPGKEFYGASRTGACSYAVNITWWRLQCLDPTAYTNSTQVQWEILSKHFTCLLQWFCTCCYLFLQIPIVANWLFHPFFHTGSFFTRFCTYRKGVLNTV